MGRHWRSWREKVSGNDTESSCVKFSKNIIVNLKTSENF